MSLNLNQNLDFRNCHLFVLCCYMYMYRILNKHVNFASTAKFLILSKFGILNLLFLFLQNIIENSQIMSFIKIE